MSGTLRLGRGLAVAALVVVISAALHTAAGGCVAHLNSLGFVALTLVTAGVAVLLSAREWTLFRLIVMVGVAQLGFHYLFEGLAHSDEHVSLIAGSAVASGHGPHPLTMPLAHVLAVIVIALILRSGDRWLLTFAAFLASLLPRLPITPAAAYAPTRLLLPQAPKESGLRRNLFAFLLSHRGPPRGAIALRAA